jgi:hypothetical protein
MLHHHRRRLARSGPLPSTTGAISFIVRPVWASTHPTRCGQLTCAPETTTPRGLWPRGVGLLRLSAGLVVQSERSSAHRAERRAFGPVRARRPPTPTIPGPPRGESRRPGPSPLPKRRPAGGSGTSRGVPEGGWRLAGRSRSRFRNLPCCSARNEDSWPSAGLGVRGPEHHDGFHHDHNRDHPDRHRYHHRHLNRRQPSAAGQGAAVQKAPIVSVSALLLVFSRKTMFGSTSSSSSC